ncbi:unnamed protein product [Anisakis simplex]|uniref:Rab-GAP TBC domain-containing protein n=1 Tax=Anisakis simplex TaxID=6269 RepID=A0A3P6NC54_ANISI|nr:unnamed protein product [Anisakis simplex]
MSRLIENDPLDEQISGPVDEAFWAQCRSEPSKALEREFMVRVYRYGVKDSDGNALRRETWPYLLGLLSWTENINDKYTEFVNNYNTAVEEWKKIEKIVKIRDHEAFTAARLRHSSYNGDLSVPMRDSSMNNDVFEEIDEMSNHSCDENHPHHRLTEKDKEVVFNER